MTINIKHVKQYQTQLNVRSLNFHADFLKIVYFELDGFTKLGPSCASVTGRMWECYNLSADRACTWPVTNHPR